MAVCFDCARRIMRDLSAVPCGPCREQARLESRSNERLALIVNEVARQNRVREEEIEASLPGIQSDKTGHVANPGHNSRRGLRHAKDSAHARRSHGAAGL